MMNMSDKLKKVTEQLEALARDGTLSAHPATKGISSSVPGASLWDLFTRPTVEGLYYNGKVVTLDGYRFIGCRFDNCKLVASTLNFSIERCIIDPSCTVEYGPDALKAIRLFNRSYDWFYGHMPAFAPVKNSDGSISIDGEVR